MNFENLLTTFFTACIPAIISYLVAVKKSDNKLKELDKTNKLEIDKIITSHKSELEKLQLEYELKSKNETNSIQNELIAKIFTGELDVNQVMSTAKKFENMQNNKQTSNFVNKHKR